MLNLNRQAEVAIHAVAADMEFTIERLDENDWQMTIEAISDIGIGAEKAGVELQPLKRTYKLTNSQMSATLALFVGELEEEELNIKLYSIAEEVWRDVERYFRPIP